MKTTKELSIRSGGGLELRNLSDLRAFVEELVQSKFVPQDKRTPADLIIAIEYGMEVGLTPMASIQNIAVINGQPSIWGDALLGLVMSSPVFEDIKETFEQKGDASRAVCQVKRKGLEWHTVTFSWADAVTAGLSGKDTYQKYPTRMLQMRARSWACRDRFPDVLKGLRVAEEAEDWIAQKPAERELSMEDMVVHGPDGVEPIHEEEATGTSRQTKARPQDSGEIEGVGSVWDTPSAPEPPAAQEKPQEQSQRTSFPGSAEPPASQPPADPTPSGSPPRSDEAQKAQALVRELAKQAEVLLEEPLPTDLGELRKLYAHVQAEVNKSTQL